MSDLHLSIYILALKDSKRVQNITLDLKNHYENFTVVEAVDGNKLSNDYISDQYDLKGTFARLGYSINQNLIACALGHKKIYREFLKTNSNWALIFEEDSRLKSNFSPECINRLCEAHFAKPTIIQLFTRSTRLAKRNNWVKISENVFLFPFLARLIGSGTSAYLINREAALLGSTNKKIIGPPDWPNWHTKVSFFGVFPWLTFEENTGSQIPKFDNSKLNIWLRWLSIATGIHYFKYFRNYSSPKTYFLEEVLPLANYAIWRIRGSKYYSTDESPQII